MYSPPVLSGLRQTHTKGKIYESSTVLFCVFAYVKAIKVVFMNEDVYFYNLNYELCGLALEMFFLNSTQRCTDLTFILAFARAVVRLYHACVFSDGVPLCASLFSPPAAGVSAAVGLPAAAPAGPAGPAAASAQPSEARAAHHPARTDRPATPLPHSGSVPHIIAPSL